MNVVCIAPVWEVLDITMAEDEEQTLLLLWRLLKCCGGL
jgi:hypothetical protein